MTPFLGRSYFTRLGIGANGDGTKAMRLLARIQAGRQVHTVDELYKSMVLEQPGTYPAADAAVAHFKDLEDAYEAMVTEEKRAQALGRIESLQAERETALKQVTLIDTFGIQRPGDSPFGLWRLETEDALLASAEQENRAEHETVSTNKTTAEGRVGALERRKSALEIDLAANASHQTLTQIEDTLADLATERTVAKTRRTVFDAATARLCLELRSAADLSSAQEAARTFLASYDDAHAKLTGKRDELRDAGYEPMKEKRALETERTSLESREGRMDHRLHQARLEIAEAARIDPADLPFLGELIDVLPEHRRWRKAIETTLFGPARLLLIDNGKLDEISRAIDPLPLKHRVSFQGVETDTDPAHFDPDSNRITGKLAYKPSPFTAWIQQRLSAENTNAVCVESAEDLDGDGLRVTVNGQTRHGRAGAHGDFNAPYVIGFSKEERIREIDDRLAELGTLLEQLDEDRKGVERSLEALVNTRSAHEHVLTVKWRAIDPDGITGEIEELEQRQRQILESDDALQDLRTQLSEVSDDLKKINGEIFQAEQRISELDHAYTSIIKRKDAGVREIERIEREQIVTLTDTQRTYLDEDYTKVATAGDLAGFADGVKRFRTRLIDSGRSARDKADDATGSLEEVFSRYLEQWPDPDLSASVENYPSFQTILDEINRTGLHKRRTEWVKRLTDWSGQDLVPLAGAFSMAIDEIKERLAPVNAILARLPFGAHRGHLKIDLRELHPEDVKLFRKELNELARVTTDGYTDEQILAWYDRLHRFMALIRSDAAGKSKRDHYLNVTQHIEITAVDLDNEGNPRATYAELGGKSGGETQELVAFIVGAALRYQLGDDENVRPRFAPVLIDEGFIKADGEFTGRSVQAWKGLGFQLLIGAPYDKFTSLEPHADLVLHMDKSTKGYSSVTTIQPANDAVPTGQDAQGPA